MIHHTCHNLRANQCAAHKFAPSSWRKPAAPMVLDRGAVAKRCHAFNFWIIARNAEETGDFSFGVSVVDGKNATAGGYVTIRVPIPPIPIQSLRASLRGGRSRTRYTSTTAWIGLGNNTGAKVNGAAIRRRRSWTGVALQWLESIPFFSKYSALNSFGKIPDFTIEMWTRFDAPGGGSMGRAKAIFSSAAVMVRGQPVNG